MVEAKRTWSWKQFRKYDAGKQILVRPVRKRGGETITTKQNATWSELPSWKFNANDIEAKLSFMWCCSKEAGKMTIYRALPLSCLPQDIAVKRRKGFSALLLLQNIYMFTTWVLFFRVEFSCCKDHTYFCSLYPCFLLQVHTSIFQILLYYTPIPVTLLWA